MIDSLQNKWHIYSRSKQWWYEISGNKYYFRSTWEVVYARYLEMLLRQNALWPQQKQVILVENIINLSQ